MKLDQERLRDDEAYREELRHRCVTDHFFLAEMMGFKEFVRELHQPAVNLYFPKNPKLSIEAQHVKKKRMHLDPRGTFKTTLGRVDTMQWILAFPETITILNASATQALAKAISKATADYLWTRKERQPSSLQLLYPELTSSKQTFSTTDDKWNTPNRIEEDGKIDVDSTLAYTSPLSTQSGWHPYILNPDDMVDTKNSGIGADPEVRRGVIDTYHQNLNVLRAGGYVNMRGTRYHPFDLYGVTLEKMDPDEWEVLIRSTLTVKSGLRLMPGEFPAEDEVEMHFAALPGMGYKQMRAKFYDNYESFMAQQQNDPQGGNVPLWDERLWQTMLTPPEKVPAIGETYCCWRFPYGAKKHMATAEGIAARIYEGKLYIVDAWVMQDPSPSRLAEKVVREAKRQQTNLLVCEDLPGVHYLEAHIRNEALRRNHNVRMQWLWFEEDEHLRIERMRNTEPQARAGKILISTGAGKLPEVKRQFCNFGLVPENGLVDCVSQMAQRVPVSLLRTEIEDDEREMQIRRRHAVMSHFVFGDEPAGVGVLEEQKALATMQALESANSYGLTDILGGLDG